LKQEKKEKEVLEYIQEKIIKENLTVQDIYPLNTKTKIYEIIHNILSLRNNITISKVKIFRMYIDLGYNFYLLKINYSNEIYKKYLIKYKITVKYAKLHINLFLLVKNNIKLAQCAISFHYFNKNKKIIQKLCEKNYFK